MTVRSVIDWASIAPMPQESGICRWCSTWKREIAPAERCLLHTAHAGPHLFAFSTVTPLSGECEACKPAIVRCDAGCSQNDKAPYLGHCADCGKSFETGKPGATLCHPCEQAELKRQPNEQPEHSTYHFSRVKRGGVR